jgi:hypothetical protein
MSRVYPQVRDVYAQILVTHLRIRASAVLLLSGILEL